MTTAERTATQTSNASAKQGGPGQSSGPSNEKLVDLTRQALRDSVADTRTWAEAHQASAQVTSRGAYKQADGTLDFEGAGISLVTLDLVFETGEKRRFWGHLYGDAAGAASSMGIYIGPIPAVGEKSQCNITVMSAAAGMVQLKFFDGPLSPRGVFTGGSVGGALGKINYGNGHWLAG